MSTKIIEYIENKYIKIIESEGYLERIKNEAYSKIFEPGTNSRFYF
jgi:hypothetical protein